VSEVVIDASAALAWVLSSQATVSATAFLESRAAPRLVAPSVFSWEIRNVLLSLGRRGLLATTDYAAALRALDELQISIGPALNEEEVRELAVVAQGLGLSLFDTAYFVMAIEGSMGLASRDGGLLQVAAANGIECFDFRPGANSDHRT
jgi:predicted nucleic acid-binding protein